MLVILVLLLGALKLKFDFFVPFYCNSLGLSFYKKCRLVGVYGISTIVGYLMPNPLYTYILNIYDLVWLGFMAYQPL